jgi:hypothetical protein
MSTEIYCLSLFVSSAEHCDDPEERFVRVLQYYLAGWHIKPKGVKKPYNPVLGEFFRGRYEYSDGTRGFYVAEQSASATAHNRHRTVSLIMTCSLSHSLPVQYRTIHQSLPSFMPPPRTESPLRACLNPSLGSLGTASPQSWRARIASPSPGGRTMAVRVLS